MKKKRRGETFTEFLMALIVFGIVAAGVFSFIANHFMLLARIEARDTFLFEARYWLNAPKNKKPEAHNDVKFLHDKKILKVIRGSQSIDFKIELDS